MAKALQTDNTMLLDMLEIRTIQSLMEAFAEANEIAAGVFTPDCMRVGEPVRHSDYCKLIYKTGKGHNGCEQCDRKHMPYEGKPMSPYECHAHLQDFSVPIVAKKKKRRVLIGAIFAGQLRLAPEITKDNIRKIKIIARRYRISQNKLVAAYAKIPYFDDKRVKRIQDLMYALAYTIGQVATGRYEQHRLTQLLSTPISPAGVVEIIREFMQADACSIFTEKFGESDRIYLLTTMNAAKGWLGGCISMAGL
jgi:ligand-binding sensor protein